MKKVVVYKSKTGFTKRYAEWIAEELSCDCFDYEKTSKSILQNIIISFSEAAFMLVKLTD